MSSELLRAAVALAKGLWLRAMSMGPVHNPLNTSLAKGIATVGFRKWYERELLSGHAHMVLCLLATVGLMASLEAMHGASALERAVDSVFAVGSACVGLWALRRYFVLLSHAETVANQAVCTNCKAYGLLELVDPEPHASMASRTESSPSTPVGMLHVRCRRCQHAWLIEL